MKPNIDEYELTLAAQAGDAEALAMLVDRLRSRLFGIAYGELRHYDDAHDAVANAFVRICSHIGSLREPDRLLGWADNIMRNEVRRLAARRRPSLPLDDRDEPECSQESSLTLRIDIERALRQLTPRHAQALTLHYLDGEPIAEIAIRAGQPVGTVKSWLHHGRKRLKLLLEEYSPMIQASEPLAALPLKRAVVVHSDLSPEMVDRVLAGLRRRGYAGHVPAVDDFAGVDLAYVAAKMGMAGDWAAQFDAIVIDEVVHGVPAIAQVVNLRSDPAIRDLALYVLVSEPVQMGDNVLISAYFNAGVNGLIVKNAPSTSEPVFSDERALVRWDRLTSRAGLVLQAAIEAAHKQDASHILPEHVLAGITLVADNLAARILSEDFRIDLHALRTSALAGRDLANPVELSDDQIPLSDLAEETIRLAQTQSDAMGHLWLGAEHFLLALIKQSQTPASRILASYGVSADAFVERTLAALEAMSFEE